MPGPHSRAATEHPVALVRKKPARHWGWKYIDIAAVVLQTQRKPLRAEEIVRIATDEAVLHSAAKFPATAMRARLSSDVRAKGFDSIFQRVGPNRFALREWELPEYFAPPFEKELPRRDGRVYTARNNPFPRARIRHKARLADHPGCFGTAPRHYLSIAAACRRSSRRPPTRGVRRSPGPGRPVVELPSWAILERPSIDTGCEVFGIRRSRLARGRRQSFRPGGRGHDAGGL